MELGRTDHCDLSNQHIGRDGLNGISKRDYENPRGRAQRGSL